MTKILIVEDDMGIINSLSLYLENSNFEVEKVFDGWQAVETILNWDFDCVILDLNLPKKDGITICKEVRETSDVPIIILTARSGEIDKITWLEIGADDYILKPFSPGELIARIHSILRRVSPNGWQKENHFVAFQDITLDTKKVKVLKWNTEILFTKNEFEILKKIFEEDGNMVERETLMTEIIWYDNYVFDRTIDTHIKNIRKKLGDKDIILTVRWQWYRLNK